MSGFYSEHSVVFYSDYYVTRLYANATTRSSLTAPKTPLPRYSSTLVGTHDARALRYTTQLYMHTALR